MDDKVQRSSPVEHSDLSQLVQNNLRLFRNLQMASKPFLEMLLIPTVDIKPYIRYGNTLHHRQPKLCQEYIADQPAK